VRRRLVTLFQAECGGTFLERGLVLAGQATPLAQGIKAIAETVLIDDRRQRAELLELLGWRHQDAGLGADPAPVIESVLGDDAYAGGDQVAQPCKQLHRIEIGAVEMANRKIAGANIAALTPSNADAADIALPSCPAGAHIGAQAIVLGLEIKGDDTDAAQIRQLCWGGPDNHDANPKLLQN
jgi:hypothetical protein